MRAVFLRHLLHQCKVIGWFSLLSAICMLRCLVNFIPASQAYAMRTALRVLTFSLCLTVVHCFPHILLALSYGMIWLHIFEGNESFGMMGLSIKKKNV